MTEVDMIFQVAASRIQGLTAKVNYWNQRANELEAALGTEKAARIEAEATLSRTLNSWVGQIARTDQGNELETQAENKRLGEFANLRLTFDAVHSALGIESGEDIFKAIEEHNEELTELLNDRKRLNTELNLVKQERDCAKSEWDRAEGRCKALGEEVADLFSDRQRLKAELAVIKDERDELRAKCDSFTKERDGFMIQAQAAATPQPGDTVRLVRFPTPKECREWSDEFGKIGELATVMSDDDEPCPFCVSVVRSEGCMNWPLSCVEVVKGDAP